MNDDQTSAASNEPSQQASNRTDTQDAGSTDFSTLAKSSYDNVKLVEDEAATILSQMKKMLAEATDASDKLFEAAPKFAAIATEVEVNRSAVAAHSKQVDEAQKRSADVRGDLDAILVSAKQSQADADAIKQAIEAMKATSVQADADIQKAKAGAEANAILVTAALTASNGASAKVKGLADKAATIEQSVSEYEVKLEELRARCEAQLQEITALLPGATSAGLASAFDKRRQTFLNPTVGWQRVFIGSVVILAVMAFFSLLQAYFRTSTMTYQDLFLQWLSRLPFAAALVWLAMHASRESALAKRLEEDYGFKASVASSFQGFQEQMTIVGASSTGNEPLKALCDATLAQITNPPGRIYEKHALSISPTTELLKAAQAFVDAAKAAKLPTGG